ncbi:MAG: tetratricopeptide repeat protein [Myxococcales bacterium]|nr:tetratricopeptide repeat protein [Myxococcales bacterium]
MALGAVISHLAAPAFAQSSPAEAPPSFDLVRRGIAARREGNDAEAVTLFRRAVALDPRPMVIAQLGLALQATGAWEEAERHLAAALARSDDAWISGHRAILEEAAQTIASHLCSLEVSGTPVGAQLFVNGASAGTLPLASPLRLRTGTVSVELRADGFYPQERRVELVAGERFREQFALIERPRDTTNAGQGGDRSGPRVGGRVAGTGQGLGAARSIPRVVAAPPPYAAISITAGGALLGLAGAVVAGFGAARVGALRERCAATDIASTEALECPDDRSIVTARDEADAMLVAGQTLAIVGGAAAVAGAVYWVIAARRAPHGAVVVAPTATGAVVGGAF